MRSKGFTLVELSIVLVIIGLLIGGILVAQSMISTAKTQQIIRNLQQYEVAINNFRLNYKKYPGDSSNFIPPGNNDEQLDLGGGGSSSQCNGLLSNSENQQVFAHLVEAGMITGNYVPYSPATACGGPHSDNIADIPGVVEPYTEIEGPATAVLGSKPGIDSYYVGGTWNFSLMVEVMPITELALEAKLGSVPFVGSSIGLANSAGQVGYCSDGDLAVYPCTDSRSVYGQFYYMMALQ